MSYPHIYDETVLKSVRDVLKNPMIRVDCEDYRSVLKSVQREDFVYLDPPYQPISRTSSFTKYTPSGFTLSDQKRLAECVMDLDSRGCLVMMSNSYHSYIKRLYKNLAHKGRVEKVYAARAVSSVGTGRGKIPEYLITNYRSGP